MTHGMPCAACQLGVADLFFDGKNDDRRAKLRIRFKQARPAPLSTARRSQPVANAHCCVANAHCCVANAVRSASSPSRSDVSAGPRIASSPSTPSIEPVAVCAPAHANAPGSFPDARLRVPRVSTESTPCEKIQSSPASTLSVQFADQFMRENPGSFADVLGDIGGFSSSSLVGPALSSCNLTV